MRLTLPYEDDDTVVRLAESYGRLVLKWLLEQKPGELHPALGRPYGAFMAVLARAARADTAGVLRRLRSPSISTLANLAWFTDEPADRDQHLAEVLGLAGYELALGGLFAGGAVALPWRPGSLWSIEQGIRIIPAERVTAAVLRDGLLELRAGEAREHIELGPGLSPGEGELHRAEVAFLPLAAPARLALHDNNPQYDIEWHPDKEGNALSLGGHDPEAWSIGLNEAFALIVETIPAFAPEMAALLRQIVPVGYDDEKHLSASYQANEGTLYLTLHPQTMTMAEAVIHEFQHNKLNLLLNMDRVMLNGPDERYSSPVRPDPRPILGVLLAAHAFLPVAELYRRLEASDHPMSKQGFFSQRYAQIVEKNRDAMEIVLKHGRPTPRGQALVEEMAALQATWG